MSPLVVRHPASRPEQIGSSRGTGLLFRAPRPQALIVAVHGGGCNASYFDLPGFSVAAAAVAEGFSVLAVNRRRIDQTAVLAEPDFAGQAHAIGEFVDEVRASCAPKLPVVLVGQSIGGAIAMMVAAQRPELVAALAVSGIGIRPTAAALAWGARAAGDHAVEPVPELLFGPPHTFSWKGAKALRAASDIWHLDEVTQALVDWPDMWRAVASRIKAPVMLRLAEHEQLWENAWPVLSEFAAGFVGAERVDVAILPDGGHLYEVHRQGAALIGAQLNFFRTVLPLAMRHCEPAEFGAG